MKHILNNISEAEKQAIREQHEGGMKIDTSRFKSLLESKSGNVKPLLSERDSFEEGVTVGQVTTSDATPNFDKNYFMTKKTGTANFDENGFPVTVDGVQISDYDNQWKKNFSRVNIGGRGFQGGDLTWTYGDKVSTGVMGPNEFQAGVSFKDKNGQEVGTVIF